ncbi:hypothetical protein [Pseudoalteromonas sp. PPB1]|uniref:hypothetical protein n=1 Tax=Pseudoalteromonas sp. PPB1 TaxID=2756136 RepID=UPI0018912F50|nr:hypothetical protein [Pseudoalteromonas sp. PPB1]
MKFADITPNVSALSLPETQAFVLHIQRQANDTKYLEFVPNSTNRKLTLIVSSFTDAIRQWFFTLYFQGVEKRYQHTAQPGSKNA